MKKVWLFITALKNAIGNLIFLGILGIILFAMFAQDTKQVPESAVMIIDPEGMIVEQKRTVDPFEQILTGDNATDEETLGRDLIDAINFAADDDRIKAVALDLGSLTGSTLPLYNSIGKALNDFKTKGKPVYAFGSGYSQSQYYLASFADKIYIDETSIQALGGVFMQGFGAYPLYMKSALDKLQVTMHVIRAGVYKDAGEIFIRDDMSDFSRESNQELVDTLWNSYLTTVSKHREISQEDILGYINDYDTLLLEHASNPARLAVQAGLIDDLISRKAWRKEMQGLSGVSGDSYQHIDYRSYLGVTRPPMPIHNPATEKVAVIVAKGTILDGDQPAGDVGGDSLARLIRKARNSDNIKAIVLRIDSPGGSSSASELIRSELAETQASGKPVVASMGGYAASGGYWIASTANKIFSQETTVTGSIGVFATFPTFERSLEYLGLHSDGVGTTALSGSFNAFSEINPIFERTLQSSVNHTYQRFLSLVSEGRGLSIEQADAIAQGRVWTGDRALQHGLVDAIGDLDDAIESAAMLADIDGYDVIYMEKELSPREQVLRQIMESSIALLPPLGPGFVSIVPHELRTLAKRASAPTLYLECLSCRITF
ncbi:MAG: signal peptide peptidase SppA [Pseudomonadales bacterium]|nr:signal peptide peptidase SppA [Pseudomonadales bacterium]MBO6701845.1 signal peptide peptidase SppA [Pseudomonadales bacterium]MBO7005464.1 signal peptide peptidase SppA [Pseudomonadales bacterium]